MTASDPSLIPPVLGALTGALTGAVAGGIAGWWIAPTRAEREERGRKRVDGRRDALAEVNAFDVAVREFRQHLYRQEVPDRDAFEVSAVRFAGEIRHVAPVLPWFEKRRLVRRVRKVVGPGYWREAELRPRGIYNRKNTDPAALAAVADTRPHTAKSLLSPDLASTRPTDQQWDRLVSALSSLRSSLS